jgi:hypothetical protein
VENGTYRLFDLESFYAIVIDARNDFRMARQNPKSDLSSGFTKLSEPGL